MNTDRGIVHNDGTSLKPRFSIPDFALEETWNRKYGFEAMTMPQRFGITLLLRTSVRSSNTPLKSRDMSTSLLCRKSATIQHTQCPDYTRHQGAQELMNFAALISS